MYDDNGLGYNYYFSEGLSAVQKDGRVFFIDHKNNRYFDHGYNYAGPFKDGIAKVQNEKGHLFINKSGKQVGTIFFNWPPHNFSEKMAAVKKDGKWGFIDEKGDVVIKPQYEKVWDFKEGLAAVKSADDRDSIGFIDKFGNVKIPFIYQECSQEGIDLESLSYTFDKDRAFVCQNNNWKIINKNSQPLLQFNSGWRPGWLKFDDKEGLLSVSLLEDSRYHTYLDSSTLEILYYTDVNCGSGRIFDRSGELIYTENRLKCDEPEPIGLKFLQNRSSVIAALGNKYTLGRSGKFTYGTLQYEELNIIPGSIDSFKSLKIFFVNEKLYKVDITFVDDFYATVNLLEKKYGIPTREYGVHYAKKSYRWSFDDTSVLIYEENSKTIVTYWHYRLSEELQNAKDSIRVNKEASKKNLL